MSDRTSVVVVGAGIAGLVLADVLSRAGRRVVVVERDGGVGGLARSHRYGEFTFDLGPHRFHSDVPAVNEYVLGVLGSNHTMIERRSAVRMFGAFLEWPLRPAALLRMPLPVLARVAGDALRRRGGDPESFAGYVRARYGETLHRVFFEPYTEKFLGVTCDALSRDWAVTGVERAVIDRRIPLGDLGALAASLLLRRRPLRFIYPRTGGIQTFCDLLRDRIVRNGGRVVTGAVIDRARRGRGGIESVDLGGEAIACERLVWTAPIDALLALLDEPPSTLAFRSLVLFNYRLRRRALVDDQWCYFGEVGVPFSRVSLPARFASSMAPPDRDGVCVEVTCRSGDATWLAPERIEADVRRGLVQGGVLASERDVEGVAIERVEHAYPIYSMGYRAVLDGVRRAVARHGNVTLLGRTGAFWYNNMDHSIEAAMALAAEMT